MWPQHLTSPAVLGRSSCCILVLAATVIITWLVDGNPAANFAEWITLTSQDAVGSTGVAGTSGKVTGAVAIRRASISTGRFAVRDTGRVAERL